MRNIFRSIRKSRFSYRPLIEVMIFQENLRHNLHAFKRRYGSQQIAPVLKSNAYGHGLIEVARIVDSLGCPFLVVDSYYEALVLRNEGIKTPILVIGYTFVENMAKRNLPDVSFTISSLEQLKQIGSIRISPRSFHLKIDTGMHRQGILASELARALKLIKANPNIRLDGICTHFADADTPGSNLMAAQIKVWNKIVRQATKEYPSIPFIHAQATAGLEAAKELTTTVSRLGLGLYGINAHPDAHLPLKPALEMRSLICGLRTLQVGERVGYNGTFQTKNPTVVATVPAGYFEGVDRRLSNSGSMNVNGTMCPIIGRVSMNMTTLDVTNAKSPRLHDTVVIYSKTPQEKNSIESQAAVANTIPYELLVHIPQHIRRTVV